MLCQGCKVLRRIQEWLPRKWRMRNVEHLSMAYAVTFSTEQGRLVLQDLMDSVYCTIYEGTDPIGVAHHNGQRSVVQMILENIDLGQQPAKYKLMEAQNGSLDGRISTR